MPEDRNYTEVVISGGPCAGKSTGMAYLAEKLSDRGIRTLVVPEVATTIIGSGLGDLGSMAQEDPKRFLRIEEQMILMQRDLRRTYQQLASALSPQPVVILYDRAEMDAMAYVGEDGFHAILDDNRLTLTDVRDSYDVVIHLVTAAIGAEEHYTTANNQARRETVEQAREADRRTLRAWTGHPHLWIADNSRDLEHKLRRVLQVVLHTIGLPAPVEIEKKFLLDEVPDLHDAPLDQAVAVQIRQTYLRSDSEDVELRVRERAQQGHSSYFFTRKEKQDDGSRLETEQIISAREYQHLLLEADPDLAPVHKTRLCFPYRDQYCELDLVLVQDRDPICLLEIEMLDLDQEVVVPESFRVRRDVTDEGTFSNRRLAACLQSGSLPE